MLLELVEGGYRGAEKGGDCRADVVDGTRQGYSLGLTGTRGLVEEGGV